MQLNIMSYRGLDGLPFGATPDLFTTTLGLPRLQRKNRSGETVQHFNGFMICFESRTNQFRECTFVYETPVHLNGVAVNWSTAGLLGLCMQDSNPMQCGGVVVLMSLGIAISGIADDDLSERSLSAFRSGEWDIFNERLEQFDHKSFIDAH